MAISPVRPASTTAAVHAVSTASAESAKLLMKLLDQSKSVDRPFDDEDDTIPPDGVLDRGEFPSATFDMIDRLELSDGRISQTELARAIEKLDAPTQAHVLRRAQETHERATSIAKRFGVAFGSFAVGGLSLVGGLVLGGPIGLAVAGLGVLGLGGGFGLAIASIVQGGQAGQALFKDVDAAFSQLK